jgi:hypothetical protein
MPSNMARAGVLVAALLSSGCLVLSLQPVYDTASVVFDEALIGTWTNTEDDTSATIERGEWRSYKVAYTDRFSTRTFHGNLTRIGAAAWLDLTEVRGRDDGPFLLPVHGLFRVSVAGDVLSVAPLDYGWFTRAIEQKLAGRPLATFDDRRNVVISSSTAELRRGLTSAPAGAVATPTTYKRAGGAGEAGGAGGAGGVGR